MTTLDLSEYVRVVNQTDKVIKGQYDGKEYVFRINDPLDVHQLVAGHIFGLGYTDKTNAFHRLGWLVHLTQEEALERLEKIKFDDVPSAAISITSAPKRGRPRKTDSAIPLADVGVESGEGSDPFPVEAPEGFAGEL
jgi:hypothetical protein